MHRLWRHQAGLVGLFAALYFFNLGGTHLWDEDEAYFAAAARETCTTGNYVVPTFNGQLSLHKPAFMYWIMRGGVALFGENEFAVRCGSALFGIANVLLVYHLARTLFSAGVGWWSAFVYGTSLQIFLINRAAIADPELSFFCTLALLFFVLGSKWRHLSDADLATAEFQDAFLPSRRHWLLTYAALSIAVLIKGPVGIVLPMAVIGLFLLLSQWQLQYAETTASHPRWVMRLLSFVRHVFSPVRIATMTLRMQPLLAIAALTVIAAPWYIAVGILTNGEWPAGFLGVHNLGRFSTAMEGHQAGPWFFVLAIVVGIFPWCLFNLQVAALWKRSLTGGLRERLPYFLLTGWVAVWVVTFTLASTKLPHYVAPAYPAVAILFGRFADRWWRSADKPSVALLRTAWGSLIFVGLAIMIALPIASQLLLPGIGRVGLVGLIPFAAGILGLIFEERQQRRPAGVVLALMAVSFGTVLLNWGAPQVDQFQSSPRIGQWISEARQSDGQLDIAIWGGFDASLVYYLGQPVQRIDGSQIQEFRDEADREAYLIVTEENFSRLSEADRAEWEVIHSTRRFLRDDTLLLTRPAASISATRLAEQRSTALR